MTAMGAGAADPALSGGIAPGRDISAASDDDIHRGCLLRGGFSSVRRLRPLLAHAGLARGAAACAGAATGRCGGLAQRLDRLAFCLPSNSSG